MSDNQFTGVWFCRGKHILCICYSLYDVCRLIERDVDCTSETLLLLAYAVASLRPKSHACPETGLNGAQTAYIGHRMPGIVHEDGEMNEMTLLSRYEWMGKKHFSCFQTPETGGRTGERTRYRRERQRC